jgi:hypothetical protein
VFLRRHRSGAAPHRVQEPQQKDHAPDHFREKDEARDELDRCGDEPHLVDEEEHDDRIQKR